jgi:phage terminase small subunit
MAKLSDQQCRFVAEYEKIPNPTRAAIRAGYSEETARKAGEKLLRNPRIITALGLDKPTVVPMAITITQKNRGTDDLISNLWNIIDFDITSVSDYDGTEIKFKPFAEWPEGASRAVLGAKVKEFKDGTIVTEFMFENRIKAIEKIGQYEGIWTGFDQLVAGLKAYGIELVRNGHEFEIKKSGLK